MSLQRIFVPLSYGSARIGSEFAHLVFFQRYPELQQSFEICEQKLQAEDFQAKLKFKNTVFDALQRSYDLMEGAEKTLLLGGDHAIAVSSISRALERNPNLGVLWVDAHGDINTMDSSESGHIHGMPISILMGLDGLNITKNLLKKENLVLFGSRDIDQDEQKIIDKLGVKYFDCKYIREVGYSVALQEALDYLKSKTDELHVSFDLDAIDSAAITGVSTPVPEGIFCDESIELFEKSFEQFTVNSVDIVEFNPRHDDGRTLEFFKSLYDLADRHLSK